MKHFAISAIVAVLFCAGCSKKEASAEADSTAPSSSAATKSGKGSAEVSAALNSVNADIEAKKYDEAVSALAAIKMAPKTERDEQAYREKVMEVQQQLLEQSEKDARAKESYQMLGRMIQGR